VAIFSPEHGVTGELDVNSGAIQSIAPRAYISTASTATRRRAGIHPKACSGSWMS
jgi:hypothetical protein